MAAYVNCMFTFDVWRQRMFGLSRKLWKEKPMMCDVTLLREKRRGAVSYRLDGYM